MKFLMFKLFIALVILYPANLLIGQPATSNYLIGVQLNDLFWNYPGADCQSGLGTCNNIPLSSESAGDFGFIVAGGAYPLPSDLGPNTGSYVNDYNLGVSLTDIIGLTLINAGNNVAPVLASGFNFSFEAFENDCGDLITFDTGFFNCGVNADESFATYLLNIDYSTVIPVNGSGQPIPGFYPVAFANLAGGDGSFYGANLTVVVQANTPASSTCTLDVIAPGGLGYDCLGAPEPFTGVQQATTSVIINGGTPPYKIMGSGIYAVGGFNYPGTGNGYLPQGAAFDFGIAPSFGLLWDPAVLGNFFPFLVNGNQPWQVLVQDAAGCIVAAEGNFDVPNTEFDGIGSGTICQFDPILTLFAFAPAFGTFASLPIAASITNTGPGTAQFDPFVAGPGRHTITYCVGFNSDCFACTEKTVYIVPIFSITDVTVTPAVTSICESGNIETFTPDGIANIAAIFTSAGALGLDPGNTINELNDFISWSGPGVTDLNNGTGSATFDPSVAGVGTHVITVTVGYTNCPTSYPFVIDVYENLDLNPGISGDLIICSGETTTLDVGSGFETYIWSNGAATPSITVPPGTYNVTVTDASGCSGATTATITAIPALVVTINGDPTVCNGEDSFLSATAGFAQYAWSTGQFGAGITVTTPGNYSVTVTDVNGCSDSASMIITETPDEDSDGICDANDSCPNIFGQFGSDCDDLNPNTVNDIVQGDCTCMGTLLDPCAVVEQWTNYWGSYPIYALADEANYIWIGTGGIGLTRLNKITGEKKYYQRSNSGLPSNYITDVEIDASGQKWIGTYDGGIAVYSGSLWTVYDVSNSGLPSNQITTVAIDIWQNIWIGTYDGGLAKFDGVNWSVFNIANSGLPENNVTSIAFNEANGNIWIGTDGGGLAQFNGLDWTIYNITNSELPSNVIKDIAIDSYGILHIATNYDHVTLYDSYWAIHNIPVSSYNISVLTIDSDDNSWIGLGACSPIGGGCGSGIIVQVTDLWLEYNSFNSGLPDNRVSDIIFDSEGNAWIGTYDGNLAKYNGSEWVVYNTSNSGLPSSAINTIAIDTQGNKWIGTYSGLLKFNDISWTIFNSINTNLPYDGVSALAIDGFGNKWIGAFYTGICAGTGCPGGIYKLDQFETNFLEIQPAGISFEYINWLTTENDYVWITGSPSFSFGSQSLMAYNQNTSQTIDYSFESLHNSSFIIIDEQSNKWVGTWGNGLLKFDGINWTIFNMSNSEMPSNSITSIAIDATGNKWIGTYEGLVKYNDTTWTVFNTSNSGLPSNRIKTLAVDTIGNLWVGIYDYSTQEGGVVKLSENNLIAYNTSNSGLLSNNINSINIDINGNVWIGTEMGLSVLSSTSSNCPCPTITTSVAQTQTVCSGAKPDFITLQTAIQYEDPYNQLDSIIWATNPNFTNRIDTATFVANYTGSNCNTTDTLFCALICKDLIVSPIAAGYIALQIVSNIYDATFITVDTAQCQVPLLTSNCNNYNLTPINVPVSVNAGDNGTAIWEVTNGCFTQIITIPYNCPSIVIPCEISLPLDINGTLNICELGCTSLTASSGFSNYTWSVSDGGEILGDTNAQSVQAVAVGTYTVTVTDINGCTGSTSRFVTQVTGLNIQSSVDDYCIETPIFTADLTITFSGTPPFNLSWIEDYEHVWVSDYEVVLLNAPWWLQYVLQVTPQVGQDGCETCEISYGIVCLLYLCFLPQPNLTALTPTIACEGDTIVLQAEITEPLWDCLYYQWEKDGEVVSYTKNNTLSVAESGTYSVVMYDHNFCSCEPISSDSIDVTFLNSPNPSITSSDADNIICSGESVTLTVSGGETYQWSDGLGEASSVVVSPVSTKTYVVTATNDNGCSQEALATIFVDQALAVELAPFNPLCSLDAPINLNTIQNGITGTWSGSGVSGNQFNPSGLNGIILLTFTPDAGQCALPNTTTINVTAATNAIFSNQPPAILCNTDAPLILNTIQNGITGTWSGSGVSGNQFNPSGIVEPSVTLTFTPDAGQCALSNTATINITVATSAIISNPPPVILCNTDAPLILNTIQNGITGTWSGSGVSGNQFNPSGLNGIILLTFTPDAGQCALPNTTTINVTVATAATISNPAPAILCNTDAPLILNTIQNGITGTWSGNGVSSNQFNPSGIVEPSVTLTFTPDAGQCALSNTATINITVATAAIISNPPPAIVCNTDAPLILNTIQNGISGTWSGNGVSGNQFNPLGLSGNLLLTFTPVAGQCALSNTATINVTVATAAIISNPPPAIVCNTDAPLILNTIQNGISGTWSGNGVSGNQFIPLGLNGNIPLTFTPDAGLCVLPNTASINVSVATTAIIGNPPPANVCDSDAPLTLIALQNGIMGTWSGAGVSGNQFTPAGLSGDISLSFTPLPGECALPGSIVLSVTFNLAESTLPSGFSLCAGELQFLNDLTDGLAGTWSGEGVFSSLFFSDLLQPGSYPLTFTYSGATQCNTATLNAQVIAPIDTLNSSISCNDTEYDISFTIQGGMPPYSANGAPLPGNGYNSYNQTGMTTLTLTDAAGCELPLQFSSLDCTNVAENPCNILATAQFIGIQDNSGHECEVGISISVLNGPTGLYEYSLDGINFQAENKFWLDTSILQQAYTPITAYVRHANCGTHAIDTLNVPAPPLSGCRLYIGPDLWAEIIDDYNQYRFVLEWMDGSYEPSIQTYEGEPVSVLVTDTLTFCTKLFTSKAPLLPRQTGVFYPNPNHGGLFYYTLPETLLNQPIRAEVFNVAGQLVADVSPQPDADHTFTIDLRLHGEGMFIMRLQIGNWVEVHKVVVWV